MSRIWYTVVFLNVRLMGPGLVTAGLFLMFEHSSFMVKRVVTAFSFV